LISRLGHRDPSHRSVVSPSRFDPRWLSPLPRGPGVPVPCARGRDAVVRLLLQRNTIVGTSLSRGRFLASSGRACARRDPVAIARHQECQGAPRHPVPLPTTTGNRCRSGAASRASGVHVDVSVFLHPTAPYDALRRRDRERSTGRTTPSRGSFANEGRAPTRLSFEHLFGHRDGRAGAGGRPTRRTSRPKTTSPPFPPRRGSGFGAVEVLFIATRSFATRGIALSWARAGPDSPSPEGEGIEIRALDAFFTGLPRGFELRG